MKKNIAIVLALVMLLMGVVTSVGEAVTLGNRLLYFGARGNDVKSLQKELAKEGYFTVEATGYFGPITEKAVIDFQKDNGIRIDGMAGYETINELKDENSYKNTANVNRASGYRINVTQEELNLLTRAVYSEARGESYEGQVAVAAVILNRVADPRFPNTIKGVIFEPWAFTAVHDGQFWLTPDPKVMNAVDDALKGWDPTEGAVFYYNPAKVTSYWIYTREIITKIGRHYFAK
jgi:N-acetylmuramoyl-L-alanine amidase